MFARAQKAGANEGRSLPGELPRRTCGLCSTGPTVRRDVST
jgi:hypothetical protein